MSQPPFGQFAPSGFDRTVMAVTSRLPNNWPGRRLAILLRRAVTMRLARNGSLDVERLGLRLRLHPKDNGCEKNLLFTPQMYEPVELAALAAALQPRPATFIDIGANVGLFSLYAAKVAPHAKVIAIEPAPGCLERLRFNLQCNGNLAIRTRDVAVGDFCGEIGIQYYAPDLGGTMMVPLDDNARPKVECLTLLKILEQEQVSSVEALKIDVEGMEDSVLMPFFRDAPRSLWPRLIIIEDTSIYWRVDLFAELKSRGYVVQDRTKLNYIFHL
jgi:FkbM family methyltransferase